MESVQELVNACRVATPHDAVLNSECAYSFHSPFSTDSGILVNLGTFIGTSQELAMNKSDNERGIFVRIVKKRVPKETSSDMDETQPTKLGVGVDGGFASPEDDFEIVSKYSIVVLDKEGKVVCDLDYDASTKSTFPDQVVKSPNSIFITPASQSSRISKYGNAMRNPNQSPNIVKIYHLLIMVSRLTRIRLLGSVKLLAILKTFGLIFWMDSLGVDAKTGIEVEDQTVLLIIF
jgi:hypothetical protein